MSNLAQIAQSENVVKGAFRRNILVRAFRRVQAWNQRRLAILELNAMSDSLLKDLGIERYQISDVVNRKGEFTGLESIVPVHQAKAAVTSLHKAAA
ncbi:MAG: DUF1127 domain-containing protein [bacterium]